MNNPSTHIIELDKLEPLSFLGNSMVTSSAIS